MSFPQFILFFTLIHGAKAGLSWAEAADVRGGKLTTTITTVESDLSTANDNVTLETTTPYWLNFTWEPYTVTKVWQPWLNSTIVPPLANYSFKDCCVQEGIRRYCAKRCDYNVDYARWLRRDPFGINSCRKHIETMLRCGAGGRNNTRCCMDNGVPIACNGFCAIGPDSEEKELPNENDGVRCIRHSKLISSCYESGLWYIPAPPEDVKIVKRGVDAVRITWSEPPSHSANVDYYVVEYKMMGRDTSWIQMNTTKLSMLIDGLYPGGSYFARVTSVNMFGQSMPTKRISIRLIRPSCRIYPKFLGRWYARHENSDRDVAITTKYVVQRSPAKVVWAEACIMSKDIHNEQRRLKPIEQSVLILRSAICYRCLIVAPLTSPDKRRYSFGVIHIRYSGCIKPTRFPKDSSPFNFCNRVAKDTMILFNQRARYQAWSKCFWEKKQMPFTYQVGWKEKVCSSKKNLLIPSSPDRYSLTINLGRCAADDGMKKFSVKCLGSKEKVNIPGIRLPHSDYIPDFAAVRVYNIRTRKYRYRCFFMIAKKHVVIVKSADCISTLKTGRFYDLHFK